MSVKKLKVVKAARKPQGTCSKCGDLIGVGDPYRYWKPMFRSRTKRIRCMKAECTPRPSERESSAMATVLAAVEGAQDEIGWWERSDSLDTDVLQNQLDAVGEALDEVIDQYREAADNFGGGGPNAEKADELEGMKDDLDVTFEDPPELEACELHTDDAIGMDMNQYATEADLAEAREGCNDCIDANLQAWNNWRSEQADAARDAISEIG